MRMTLVLTDGQLPRDLLQALAGEDGALQLTSLPGFLSDHNAPLVGLLSFERITCALRPGALPEPHRGKIMTSVGRCRPADAEAGHSGYCALCAGQRRGQGPEGLQAFRQ